MSIASNQATAGKWVVLVKMLKWDGLVNANECRKEMKQRRKKGNRKEK